MPRQEVGSKKEAVLTPALRPKAFLSKLKKTLPDVKSELELRFLNFCVFPGPEVGAKGGSSTDTYSETQGQGTDQNCSTKTQGKFDGSQLGIGTL